MDKYNLKFSEDGFKYIDIYNKIKELIDENKLKDGEKLPTIRELSKYLRVNKITIINTYKKLEQEGYVRQVQGSGTYVKKRTSSQNFKKDYNEILRKITSLNSKEWIDFTGEITSASFFKIERLRDVLNDVLNRDGVEALMYNDSLGYKSLRESISLNFWENKIDPDEILIISGAQQGIDITAKTLIHVNDSVLVEKPTHGGALGVFKLRRANILEVPILNDGADLDCFERILKKNKIKCFYTMSYFQNPTGISYSMEKKKKIIELAYKYDFYIIEDDYLSELVYDENIEYCPYRKLDQNRVIYIKSFSKTFLPGVRIGYLIAPTNLCETIQNSKVTTDIATSSLMQRALEKYISTGFFIDHIKCLNSEYSKRYNYIVKLIKEKLGDLVTFNEPKGGLNIFLNIKEDVDITSRELFYKLKDKNTIITPGEVFYNNFKDGEKSFRIGFSQTDYKSIDKGIENIYKALTER
ncbi:MAG: PLP-dependent aminotransferase family protein [Clostridium perfringens]|nr:PLP-dependent aminotransferase family protein [Clostridium perfringens]